MELNNYDFKRLNLAIDILEKEMYDKLAQDIKMIIRKLKRDD